MDKIMIKNFSARAKGPHLFLFLIFLGLGFIVLALSFKAYLDYSRHEILVEDDSSRHNPDLFTEDLLAMLDVSTDSSGDEFEVLVEKNLFSPEREAWEAPPPSDDQQPAAPVRGRRINPADFRLYGITISRHEKMALIYYQRLPEGSRNRLVHEGEIVYQDRDGGNEAYRLVSIGTDSVTLEAGGKSFEIWLFSHERQEVEPTETEEAAVVISGAEPLMEEPAEEIEDAGEEEVESTMKRVETPSGIIYRPLD